ncbi:hypothetical protein PI125_g17323 [Phytophthora idaei]|nr:hypothetical protein PI125_g17323 [Phytophthora idaei]
MPAENGDEETSDEVLTEAKGASADPIGMDAIKEADGGGGEHGDGGCRVIGHRWSGTWCGSGGGGVCGGGGSRTKVLKGILKEELQRFCASGGVDFLSKGRVWSVFVDWEETKDLEEVAVLKLESEVTTVEVSNRTRLFADEELDAMEACESG